MPLTSTSLSPSAHVVGACGRQRGGDTLEVRAPSAGDSRGSTVRCQLVGLGLVRRASAPHAKHTTSWRHSGRRVARGGERGEAGAVPTLQVRLV